MLRSRRRDWFRRLLAPRPKLTIVVIAFNMHREIKRTLYTLDSRYQRNIKSADYEVIVVDNGSEIPLSASELQSDFDGQLRIMRLPSGSPSPVTAVNAGVAAARAAHVAVMVDGARMVSPGLLRGFLDALKIHAEGFVYTLGWHLGDEPQNISMTKGYNQAVEDRLLRSFDWRKNGYQLFEHACLAMSCRQGWFSKISESNCFAMSRKQFQFLGGFEARFQSPGGGLVNLDFFSRAILNPLLTPIVLLGEGSFHQFHGGVATNVVRKDHPWERFQSEYQAIRGDVFKAPDYVPIYYGSVPPEAHKFLSGKDA